MNIMLFQLESLNLMRFAELCITSNFTFLTGASHAEEYVDRAALLGLSALAITDENSVAGIVRAHTRIREIGRQVKERQTGVQGAGGPIGSPV
ncbi:MAG: PHP domain-containing protein, partial [Pseudomonadota bacterium]